MSKHLETRSKLKSIYEIKTFKELLEECLHTPEEKTLMELHYINGKDFRYIGDLLGYAESTIKKKHKKALQKIGKLI